MHISRLKIKNFRSIRHLDLQLSPMTVLVGPNNAGKSAILEAIRIVLTRRWGQRGTGFTEYDVHLPEPTSDPKTAGAVEIQIVMIESTPGEWPTELTDDLADIIQVDPINDLNSVCLSATCAWDAPTNSFVPSWQFLNIRGEPLPPRRRSLNLQDFFQYMPVFHLGPLRDAADEFSSRSQFWGRLLKAMRIPPEVEARITESLKQLNTDLIDADPRLRRIANTLNALQSVAATDRPGGVDLRVLPFNSWDILSRAEIIAQNDDGMPWLPLVRHGQGVQSLSVILLFKAFVEHALAEYYKTLATPVLTLEEPEAHLHPQAARALWGQVADLPGQRIVATHSPYFLQHVPFRDIRWVRIGAAGTEVISLPRTISQQLTWLDGLQPVIQGSGGRISYDTGTASIVVHQRLSEDDFRNLATVYGTHADRATITTTLRALQRRSQILMSELALSNLDTNARRIRGEVLFSRKWLLVEGQSEYLLVHAIADALGVSLDVRGISVVDFKNNGSCGSLASLARALNIPWRIVADRDTEGANFRRELEDNGFSATEIEQGFALLSDGDLEDQLLHDGLRPILEEIAIELGLPTADANDDAKLRSFLDDSKKVQYCAKLSARIRQQPALAQQMPETFRSAIIALTTPPT